MNTKKINSILQCTVELLSRNGVAHGILGIILVVPFFGYMIREGYEKDLAWHNHSKEVVQAELIKINTFDGDPRTGDTGGASGKYRYTMLDGKEGTISFVGDTIDEIPESIEVEYLPDYPERRRIKGAGNQNMSDLKFWTGFKVVLLSLFCLMSIGLIANGIKEG